MRKHRHVCVRAARAKACVRGWLGETSGGRVVCDRAHHYDARLRRAEWRASRRHARRVRIAADGSSNLAYGRESEGEEHAWQQQPAHHDNANDERRWGGRPAVVCARAPCGARAACGLFARGAPIDGHVRKCVDPFIPPCARWGTEGVRIVAVRWSASCLLYTSPSPRD